MFSQLGPLFKSTFRQAEANDTRQKIPHEERDSDSRKKERQSKEEKTSDFWEDNTTISVQSLRTFLVNFMHSSYPSDSSSASSVSQQTESIRPVEKNRPLNTTNAKAVRAYQSMAEKTQKPASILEESDTTTENSDKDKVQSQELRDIHKLIDDLDFLEKKGLRELRILQANSFVESLKNAVFLAKSNI